MVARLPLRVGSSDQRGDDVSHWQKWAQEYAKSYAALMGPVDGFFGNSDKAFVVEMQTRLRKSGHAVAVTGEFDEKTAQVVGYKTGGAPVTRRKIWMYTAPGSGAPWNIGPSFELGKWCEEVLKINHQPVGFPIGGYLGLMGGDPGFSYIDVITAQKVELARLLRTNPDIDDPDVELWFSGYSQSADGMLSALLELFGDGGEFAHLRSRINGCIVYGNPAKQGTGIARKVFPKWLNDLTQNVTTNGDFYAMATDRIRPLFYEWFIRAETEVPFVVYTAQIILPAIANLIPVIGPLLGPLFPVALALQLGMSTLIPLLTQVVGGTNGTTQKPNPELVELLTVQGVLTNLPELLTLIKSLPGLQAHGEYHLPKPEFNGRTGIQVACDIVAAFRRKL